MLYFNSSNGTALISAVSVAQQQLLPWWTELPSSRIDFLIAVWQITFGWEYQQQAMFKRVPIGNYGHEIQDCSTFSPQSTPTAIIAMISLSGFFRRLKRWHDGVWGRQNEWEFNSKPFRKRSSSYWELVGLPSTFSQAVSGLWYIAKLRKKPDLIQPLTGNSYLELFAVVAMMHSSRLKSNMFSFLGIWITILLIFLFHVLLKLLPNLHTTPALAFRVTSPRCVSIGCATAVGSTIQCANEQQLGVGDLSIIPWQYNYAYQALLFICLVAGLVSYWAPERFKLPGNIYRLSIIICLGVTVVSFLLQARQQRSTVRQQFLVCPNASNTTRTPVIVDDSCFCSTFSDKFQPTLAEAIVYDAVLSRFIYTIV